MAPIVLGIGSSSPLVPVTVSYRITANNDGASLVHPLTYWGGADGEPFYWQDHERRELTQVMRFTGIAIPQGATITNATLSVWSVGNWAGTPALNEYNYNDFGVEQADNPGQITNYSTGNSRRTNVGSVVRWVVPRIAGNSQSTSPDLSSIIQPIVNRPGWASGNAMVFFGAASEDSMSAAASPAAQSNGHNAGIEYRPLLEITYLGTP